MEGKICILNISEIEPLPNVGSDNPRRDMGKLFALTDSVKDLGQLQSVIVNKADGKYHLVAGKRRLIALKNAKVEKVEVKVYENLDPITTLDIINAENNDRKGFTPIEEAELMQKYIDHGFSDKEIAKKFRYSPDTVRRKLNMLQLPSEIKIMIDRQDNPLPVHHAYRLHSVGKSDQIKLARKAAPPQGPVASEEQIKQWIEDLKGNQLELDDKKLDQRPSLPTHNLPPINQEPAKGKKKTSRGGIKVHIPKPKDEDTNLLELGEINIDITGKAQITPNGGNLIFKESSTLLTICSGKKKKEIPVSLPMEILFGTGYQEVISKIKEALSKK
jgi:ParB/RepB/Spo0J family partition protein